MQIWLQCNNKYSFDREQPGLILNILVALYKSDRGYMSPGEGADWAIAPLPGLSSRCSNNAIVQKRITETKNSRGEGANWAIIPLPGLRNELRSFLEPRFAHRENYYRQAVRRKNVWAIQQYQKTYLEISWDYPFNCGSGTHRKSQM
jgi:hypothetical protein